MKKKEAETDMEKIKLQELKHELKRKWSQLKRDVKKMKRRVKKWLIKNLTESEDKKGLGRRCQFCTESYECHQFDYTRKGWRAFWKPQRCGTHDSER